MTHLQIGVHWGLIDSNTPLSNVQELCYLPAALKGEALSAIQALEITSANYSIALQLIRDRFHNTRRIIYSHVNALINLKESNLNVFINTAEEHILSLGSLNMPLKYWDSILVPSLLSKLDSKLTREWESKLNAQFSKDSSRIKNLLHF